MAWAGSLCEGHLLASDTASYPRCSLRRASLGLPGFASAMWASRAGARLGSPGLKCCRTTFSLGGATRGAAQFAEGDRAARGKCLSSLAQNPITLEGSTPGALGPPLLSVAPMMDWTDVHYRHLARLLSRHTWLYTEMVVDQTVIHQSHNLDRFLAFPPRQHPVVLQLGGNSPEALAQALEFANAYEYDEINLNCGCPSEAVSGHGCFGARLMMDPKRVASIVDAMAQKSPVPVTVKCRIGVDDLDSYEHLCHFISTVSENSPVRHFIIHSRKAFLKGLSPVENRNIPPLKYEYVLALMRDFPHLLFSLNGGIVTLQQALAALSYGVHGVMIGRAAYNTPWNILAPADQLIFGADQSAVASRRQVLELYSEYADEALAMYGEGRPNVQTLIKPLLGLFHGEKGGARYRRAFDACVRKAKLPSEAIREAMRVVPEDVLDAPPPVGPTAAEDQGLEHLAMGPLPDPPVLLRPAAVPSAAMAARAEAGRGLSMLQHT